MEKRLKKVLKNVGAAQERVKKLLGGQTEHVSAGIKRATAFLELARNEIEDFRRQYLSDAKAKRNRRKSKSKSV